jgi:tetratricopeptide (TPR) repeat protein
MLSHTLPKQFNHRVAISGLGGVGKTQLALEYVHAHKDNYRGVYWISGVNQATLLSGFQQIAKKTGCVRAMNLNANPSDTAKDVLGWLNEQENWLLVIDNLDDATVVEGYLPERSPGKHTLLTMRNPNAVEIPAEGLRVGVLDPDEAVELLIVRSTLGSVYYSSLKAKAEAAQIVKELGFLPLAIEQASAYIREVSKDIFKFLPRYKDNMEKHHSRIPRGNWPYVETVATTWRLSFERVKENNIKASKLLQLLAFLNPDGTLREFIEAGKDGLDIELQVVISDEEMFDEAISELERFSLITCRQHETGQLITMHRLVQLVIKNEMTDAQLSSLRGSAITLCDSAFPQWFVWKAALLGICRRYQDQVVTTLSEIPAMNSEVLAHVLQRVGSFLDADGKYQQASEIRLKAFNVSILLYQSDLLQEQHPDTLRAMANLAATYGNQGRWDEAVVLEERVLEASKVAPGEQHPDTLTAMANLAVTYWNQGRWDEAVVLQERVLEARKVALGEQHPDTLTAVANLAFMKENP